MEVIEFPGYIEEEKLEIARRFLGSSPDGGEWTKPGEVTILPISAVQRIIREYTFEAGVRNLEREIGRVCRKIARTKSGGQALPKHHRCFVQLRNFLGPPQFFNLEAERQNEIGVATAVAWTEMGGEIMPVEVLLIGR